jgi:hypothetical protein
LWLIVDGQHHFIEVKLAGDSVKPHQIAGLALLANCLQSERQVIVRVINLDSTRSQFASYQEKVQGMVRT